MSTAELAIGELEERLPAGRVSTEPECLDSVSIDWWPLAVVRRSRGASSVRPAAVVRPESTGEVSIVLAWATETRTPIVPRGNGSGVCGGAQASDGCVVLDLTGLTRLLAVDHESLVVRVEAGICGRDLERVLNDNGLTLGHYPQSLSLSTVGGWIATSSAGQATPGYGSIEDRVVGLTAVLPDGSIAKTRPFPRSAAGPDLKRIIIGAEGTLAVVTEASIACEPQSSGLIWTAFTFPKFESCLTCLRDWRHSWLGAAVMRGYDEQDSAHAFGALGHEQGCVAFLGFDLAAPGIAARSATADSIAIRYGATPADAGFGASWWAHRLDAIGLFERVLGPERELGDDIILDTIDVAALWSRLPHVYRSMRVAFSDHGVDARCHISHVYGSGGSLYFTFFVHGRNAVDVEKAYDRLWGSLAQACLDAGGTLTHHHGMGRLKSRFTELELGSSYALLRRIKDALDPAGILNPGVLLPHREMRESI